MKFKDLIGSLRSEREARKKQEEAEKEEEGEGGEKEETLQASEASQQLMDSPQTHMAPPPQQVTAPEPQPTFQAQQFEQPVEAPPTQVTSPAIAEETFEDFTPTQTLPVQITGEGAWENVEIGGEAPGQEGQGF
jgi:hypothetical protein